MWKLSAAVVLVCSLVLAADKEPAAGSWDKVKNLKTGSDLRIYKTGLTEAITAKSVDVIDRKLVVLIGNTETAIAKTEIDRIDYQPPPNRPVKTKTYDATPDSATMTINRSTSRDGWQTIYQRTPAK